MSDDAPQEMSIDRTAQYYINRRIDDMHKDLKEDIADLKKIISENTRLCSEEASKVDVRVNKLEDWKNRAVGAVALFVTLIGLWKV